MTITDENIANTIQADQAELITKKLADFYATYYPLASDVFDKDINSLIDSITNGGTGISAAIEAQIWQRGRERVISEGTRTQRQIIADFAGRGFTIPPGAMVAQLKELRLEQKRAINSLSRDISIKQAGIESIRCAVTKALESRSFAIQAASDYIRALMCAADVAPCVAVINSDLQAKMITATSNLYRARLARDQLILTSKVANLNARIKGNVINVPDFYQGIDARVQAAVAVAAGFYGIAAGKLLIFDK